MQQKEAASLTKALIKSKEEFKNRQTANACATMKDAQEKFKAKHPWNTIKQEDSFHIFTVSNENGIGPNIQNAISIDNDLMLNIYMNSVKLSKLHHFTFPLDVYHIDVVYEVCDALERMNMLPNSNTASLDSLQVRMQLILSLLLPMKSASFKYHAVIWFIFEQIRLMMLKSLSHSHDFMVFSSLFYNISPQAYRFFRASGNCIFSCYSTIRKLTFFSTMSRLSEQNDGIFLQYVRQKFKRLYNMAIKPLCY